MPGLWVGDCFIYNNSSWRLNYCVGGEVGFRRQCGPIHALAAMAPNHITLSVFSLLIARCTRTSPAVLFRSLASSAKASLCPCQVTTMFHLDRPMYLLGYLASQSRIYLIDKVRHTDYHGPLCPRVNGETAR